MSGDIDEVAARWHLAQSHLDMDWAAFTVWLEADPRHRVAYDAIALLDARIDAAAPALDRLLTEGAEPTSMPLRRIAGWSSLAAGIVALAAFGVVRLPRDSQAPEAVYAAAAGQARLVRLADGSQATLSPGSELRVRQGDTLAATLVGSAHFEVRHDPARLFVVHAGGCEIRDIGTRFEVVTGGAMVRVAVGEGSVSVHAAGLRNDVVVRAGRALVLGGDAAPVLEPASTASVGAWGNGPLTYEGVPLAIVAADITRATGAPVTADPAIASRRFSGVIARGNRDAMVAALSQMTGLPVKVEGDAVHLGSPAGH